MFGVVALGVALILNFGIVIISEGYVGIYYRFGALSDRILEPGLNVVVPFITYPIHQVQVTLQTDSVRDVTCGTNSGVTVKFDKIEVDNILDKNYVYPIIKNYTVDYDKILIYGKINHEMNQFCSKHSLQEIYIEKFDKLDEILTDALQTYLDKYAPGLTIRSIRFSKPIVPREVEENYKKIVEYQTEMLKLQTQQKKDIQSISIENEKKIAMIQSEKQQNIAKSKSEQEQKISQLELKKAEIQANIEINNQTMKRDMLLKQAQYDLQLLENKIVESAFRSRVDMEHYEHMKNAEYQNALMTAGYVAIRVSENLANNSKIFYGDSLPKLINFHGFWNLLNGTL